MRKWLRRSGYVLVILAASNLPAACTLPPLNRMAGDVIFLLALLLLVLLLMVVLLCGLFMLFTGGARTMKLFGMPGMLPITGISTAWQYLPIPIAGFVITFDSILFLTGIVSRDDLLYSEKEIDYTDVAALKEMEKKEDEHK